MMLLLTKSTSNKTKQQQQQQTIIMESVSGVLLPLNFQPSPNSVIIGRGKEPKQNCGNKRLRVIVSAFLEKYQRGDKKTKTQIVTDIIVMVRELCNRDFGCGNGVGSFVKHIKKTGKWYDQGDSVAREKVGYVFRDLLADSYKSSSKRKVEARKQFERSVSLTSTIVSEETTSTTATGGVCGAENQIPTILSLLNNNNTQKSPPDFIFEESLASSTKTNNDSFSQFDFEDGDFDDDHSFYSPPPLPNKNAFHGPAVPTTNISVGKKVCTMIYYNNDDDDDDVSAIEETTTSTTTATSSSSSSSTSMQRRRPSFTDLSFLDESFRSLPRNEEEEEQIQPTTTPDDNVFSFDQLMKLPLLSA